MDRIFLDANVLFSAAYRADSKLSQLWKLKNVILITSAYAIEEARYNLTEQNQQVRLTELVKKLHVISEAPYPNLPDNIKLPDKDQPILQAALFAKASHLLTGDIRHFGKYFGTKVCNIQIMLPATYLKN